MKEQVIVGLDIGTTKICCIVAKKSEGGKIEIMGSGVVPSRGVQDGQVLNIKDSADDIIAACKIASEKTGVEIKRVFVGVAGAHVKSSVIRMSHTRANVNTLINGEDMKILEDQIKNLTTSPGEEIISYQPQEYKVDNVSPINNNPVGMFGNRLEVSWHVITGNESSTRNIERCLEIANLELIEFELEPIASASAVLTKQQLQEGVCLVDIGGGTTDIAIFTKGIIRHTAIFPYAGEYITSKIQEILRLREEVAKNLKENKSFTSAMYTHIPDNKHFNIENIKGHPAITLNLKMYCKLINACLEQLFGLVKNEIAASYYKDQLNAGIVITGGGSMIPDLKNFVTEFTGYHTSIGLPINRLSNLQDKNYAHPRYATAIGLTLFAASKENEFIIEPEMVKKIETPLEELIPTIKEDVPAKNKGLIDKLKKSFFDAIMIDQEIMKDFDDLKK